MNSRVWSPEGDVASAAEQLSKDVLADPPSWFLSRGLIADVERWDALASNVVEFVGFVEDYLNELGVRQRLSYWLTESSKRPLELHRWLVGVVDEIDERFRSNSSLRTDDAIPIQSLSPEAWWLRRVPDDAELGRAVLALDHQSNTAGD